MILKKRSYANMPRSKRAYANMPMSKRVNANMSRSKIAYANMPRSKSISEYQIEIQKGNEQHGKYEHRIGN